MTISRDHYINLKNGKFDFTTRQDLKHLFTSFANDPNRNKLVVHFHGGLVSEKAGMAGAERLMPIYRDAGSYPVFFIWESDLLSVINHNLDEIFSEKIFQSLMKKLLQFAVGKLKQTNGGRGGRLELPTESEVIGELEKLAAGETPYAKLDQIILPESEILQNEQEKQFLEHLNKNSDIKNEAISIANSFRTPEEIKADQKKSRGTHVQGSTHTLMSPEIIEEIRAEVQTTGKPRGPVAITFIIKHAVSVLKRCVTRFAKGRAHGVYATIVEELLRELYLSNAGGFVWELMKKDIEDAFKDDAKRYGGTAFLEELKAKWAEGSHPSIVLIGHSTGAVYICNVLKNAQKMMPAEVKFNVIFLAPACTFNLLADTIKESGERISGIRIFGMQDKLEQADRLIPVVYPHSLLYLVSGVFETEADMPLMGMQRFYSGEKPFDSSSYPDIDSVRKFIQKMPDSTIWSKVSLGPGRNSQSARHSDFDEESETTKSLKYIIEQGF